MRWLALLCLLVAGCSGADERKYFINVPAGIYSKGPPVQNGRTLTYRDWHTGQMATYVIPEGMVAQWWAETDKPKVRTVIKDGTIYSISD